MASLTFQACAVLRMERHAYLQQLLLYQTLQDMLLESEDLQVLAEAERARINAVKTDAKVGAVAVVVAQAFP